MDGRRDGSTGGSTAGLQARDIGFVIGVAGWLVRVWATPHENVGPRRGVFSYGGHACDSWRGDAGQRFWFKRERCFDWLGYLADLGTGTLYLVAKSLETNGADVSHAAATTDAFPRRGGVLNLLAALHAYKRHEDASMNASIGFTLSHLQSMLLFALLISIAFGFLSRGGRSTV